MLSDVRALMGLVLCVFVFFVWMLFSDSSCPVSDLWDPSGCVCWLFLDVVSVRASRLFCLSALLWCFVCFLWPDVVSVNFFRYLFRSCLDAAVPICIGWNLSALSLPWCYVCCISWTLLCAVLCSCLNVLCFAEKLCPMSLPDALAFGYLRMLCLLALSNWVVCLLRLDALSASAAWLLCLLGPGCWLCLAAVSSSPAWGICRLTLLVLVLAGPV
jgi:hypothetical protein